MICKWLLYFLQNCWYLLSEKETRPHMTNINTSARNLPFPRDTGHVAPRVIPFIDQSLDRLELLWHSCSKTAVRLECSMEKLRGMKTTIAKVVIHLVWKEEMVIMPLQVGHTHVTNGELLTYSSPSPCQYCGTYLAVQYILVSSCACTPYWQHFFIPCVISTILDNDSAILLGVLKFLHVTSNELSVESSYALYLIRLYFNFTRNNEDTQT